MDKSKKATKKQNKSRPKDIPEEDDNEETLAEQNQPSLYDLLNVPKTATVAEIKKSYKALALQLHPDKNQENPEATKNFQKLAEAYHILIDPEKRHLYDKTGTVGDEDMSGFTEAYQYYRSMYPKIEKEDIEAFAKKYRNSAEETQDIMNFYVNQKGDVTLILEHIILSENSDIERFVALIEEKIKNKELKRYKNWDRTKDNIQLLPDESEELQKQQEEEFNELAQNILAKYQKKASIFDALEKKYGGKGKKNEYDIDDEEFERHQKEMMSKADKKQGRKLKSEQEEDDGWETDEEEI